MEISRKEYKHILPFDHDMRVIDQFGFIPLSVIEPTKHKKDLWKKIAYIDDDIEETKRSSSAEYLPGLKFSEFHAELAEIIIKYWSMQGSVIVDPFAGRATRAVVSGTLKRKYYGYEISKMTYDRVNVHLKKHNIQNATVYNDDGLIMKNTKAGFADLIMTCPPYHTLEKYEDCIGQLSSIKTYEKFLSRIDTCISNIYRVLKEGAFCAWVCADWRDGGEFKSFSSDTIQLFKNNGLIHYDTIIIKNVSPFAALQMDKVASKRYSSKVHEYLLVFKKPGEYDCSWYKKEDEFNKFF